MRAGKIRRRLCRSVFGRADQKCCGECKSAAVVSMRYNLGRDFWQNEPKLLGSPASCAPRASPSTHCGPAPRSRPPRSRTCSGATRSCAGRARRIYADRTGGRCARADLGDRELFDKDHASQRTRPPAASSRPRHFPKSDTHAVRSAFRGPDNWSYPSRRPSG